MSDIVMVQLPIIGPARVLDKDKVEVARIKLDARTKQAMKGDRSAYFECTWNRVGEPKLGRRITRFKGYE